MRTKSELQEQIRQLIATAAVTGDHVADLVDCVVDCIPGATGADLLKASEKILQRVTVTDTTDVIHLVDHVIASVSITDTTEILRTLRDIAFNVADKRDALRVVRHLQQKFGLDLMDLNDVTDINRVVELLGAPELTITSREKVLEVLRNQQLHAFASVQQVVRTAYFLGVASLMNQGNLFDFNRELGLPSQLRILPPMRTVVPPAEAGVLAEIFTLPRSVTEAVAFVTHLVRNLQVTSAEDITSFVRAILQGSTAVSQYDVLDMIRALCRDHQLNLKQLIDTFPLEGKPDVFPIVDHLLLSNHVDRQELAEYLLPATRLLDHLGIGTLDHLVDILNDSMHINSVEPGIWQHFRALHTAAFAGPTEVVKSAYLLGILSVVDPSKTLHSKCSVPERLRLPDIDFSEALSSLMVAKRSSKEARKKEIPTTSGEPARHNLLLADAIPLIQNIVQRSECVGDRAAQLLPAMIEAVVGSSQVEPTELPAVLASVSQRLEVQIPDLVAHSCKHDFQALLATFESVLAEPSHLYFGDREKLTKPSLRLLQRILTLLQIGWDSVIAGIDQPVAISLLEKMISQHNVNLATLVLTNLHQDRDRAILLLRTIVDQFEVSTPELLGSVAIGATASAPQDVKLTALNTLLAKYDLQLLDAVIASQPSDVLSFLRSLIEHYHIDLINLVNLHDSREILRIAKASTISILDVVQPLKVELSDVAPLIERILAEKGYVATESRARVRNEIFHILQYFGIDVFQLLQNYSIAAADICRVLGFCNVPVVEVCRELHLSKDEALSLAGGVLEASQVPAGQALRLLPQSLPLREVFEYFHVDTPDAMATLIALRNTRIHDVLPQFGMTAPQDVATAVHILGVPFSELVKYIQPDTAAGLLCIRNLIRCCGLTVADAAKVLQDFPFPLSGIAEHYRVSISDIVAIVKQAGITVESLVDVLLAGKNRDAAVKFVSACVQRYELSLMELPAHQRGTYRDITSIISTLRLESVSDIGRIGNLLCCSGRVATISEVSQVAYLFGIMAAIAGFKHPDYLDAVFAVAPDLPMSVRQMQQTILFSFPVQHVAVQEQPDTCEAGMLAAPPCASVPSQATAEMVDTLSQACAHASSHGTQTTLHTYAEVHAQYDYFDVTAELGMQTDCPLADKGEDPILPGCADVAVECLRLRMPDTTRGTQTLVKTTSLACQTQNPTRTILVQCDAPETKHTGVTAAPEVAGACVMAQLALPHASVAVQTNTVGCGTTQTQTLATEVVSASSQSELIVLYTAASQTDTCTVETATDAYAPKLIDSAIQHQPSREYIYVQAQPEVRSLGIQALRVSRTDLVDYSAHALSRIAASRGNTSAPSAPELRVSGESYEGTSPAARPAKRSQRLRTVRQRSRSSLDTEDEATSGAETENDTAGELSAGADSDGSATGNRPAKNGNPSSNQPTQQTLLHQLSVIGKPREPEQQPPQRKRKVLHKHVQTQLSSMRQQTVALQTIAPLHLIAGRKWLYDIKRTGNRIRLSRRDVELQQDAWEEWEIKGGELGKIDKQLKQMVANYMTALRSEDAQILPLSQLQDDVGRLMEVKSVLQYAINEHQAAPASLPGQLRATPPLPEPTNSVSNAPPGQGSLAQQLEAMRTASIPAPSTTADSVVPAASTRSASMAAPQSNLSIPSAPPAFMHRASEPAPTTKAVTVVTPARDDAALPNLQPNQLPRRPQSASAAPIPLAGFPFKAHLQQMEQRSQFARAPAKSSLDRKGEKELLSRLHPSGPSSLWRAPRTDAYVQQRQFQ
eukprot:TRINITY_DN16234_c0_g1_i1.p1 TRINITY_DN16234_c0_g1~~TRINITY_DN16234_c0_g1_i1.p1  ORF type:complete len:1770 (+),score=244.54 TRINITY_DN16234_c0_g1_i1:55-5364(+)